MNEARTPVNSNETVQHLEKQLRNTSKMVEDLMLQEKSTRRKIRNVTLDWSGIDEERKRHLKTLRANAKRELTRAINHVSGILVIGTEIQDVQMAEVRLMEIFEDFQNACDGYKAVKVDDDDIDECLAYFSEAEKRFRSIRERIAVWMQSQRKPLVDQEDPEVRPEDSISETKTRSHVSNRSAFSKSPRKSTISEMMVKNAVKKASLHAEMSMFERQQSIAEEELRLNKRKQKLALEVEMAKLEAEERVCSDLHFQTVGSKMNGSSGSIRRYLPRHKGDGFKPMDRMVDVNPIKVSTMDRMVDENPQNAGKHNERLVIENSGKWNMGMKTSEHENRFGKIEMEMEPFRTRRNYDGIDEKKLYSEHPDHREKFGVDQWTSPDQEVHRRSHTVVNTSGLNPRAVPWKPLPSNKPLRTSHVTNGEENKGEQYLDTVKKLAVAALLPKSELTPFDGNPLKYFTFIRSFENNVEKDTDDFSRHLQLLVQFCTGKARRAIESCILLNPQDGYVNARKILAERFGDAYRVSKSWLTKVSNGPPIKPGDKEGLQELADDLLNCEITLKATGRLAQLDNEDRLVKIMERCPVFVRARWQKHVQSIRLEGRDPNVEDVRQLIRAVAMEKNDPVYGSILDGNSRELPKRSKLRKPAQSNIQLQSFSVQQNSDKPDVKCYFCEGQHRLENCEKFKRATGEEQFHFIRSRKLCDNCLSSFHFSAGCKRRHACTIPECGIPRGIHDSVVAFERKRNEQMGKPHGKQMENSVKQTGYCGSTNANGVDGAGSDDKVMSVVPVKVKGRGSQNVVTTYALLDSGSTGTFCSESLLEQLDIKGKKCKISVSTIGNVVANCETSIPCLEVMNLDEDVCFEIPNVFSAKSLNISRTTVARQEDVDRWQHLKGIKLPREIPNGEVTLLIGIDVPEALQPHDVRKSENGGPYAIQTVFGWALNGPRKVALYRRPITKKDLPVCTNCCFRCFK